MDTISVVVMLMSLLALAGVVIFFIYDYFKHKEAVKYELDVTEEKIGTEKSDRLSNIKYVVDQVNDVNMDIYTTTTSNHDLLRKQTTSLASSHSNLVKGLNTFLTFSSNMPVSTGAGAPLPSVNIMELPGYTNPNVNLIKHVSMTMGMTVKDLQANKNKVEFCNPQGTRCIRFPNAQGNTELRSLTTNPNGKVIVDSTLALTKDMKFMKRNAQMGSISSGTNSLLLQSNKVGIGSGFSAPTAALEVMASSTTDPVFKVSLPTSEALLVDASGMLVTTKPIAMKRTLLDPMVAASFSLSNVGMENTLVIESPSVTFTGNVHITGDMKAKNFPPSIPTPPTTST
jgi:hypothetical protein